MGLPFCVLIWRLGHNCGNFTRERNIITKMFHIKKRPGKVSLKIRFSKKTPLEKFEDRKTDLPKNTNMLTPIEKNIHAQ